MKRYFYWVIIIFVVFLTSCEAETTKQSSQTSPIAQASNATTNPDNRVSQAIGKIATGETIYVPIYPKIYHLENQTLDLTSTLTIRNIDLENPIILTSVRYYDSTGKLVKQYIDCAKRLDPLASLDFLATKTQPTKSIGTSFIVEWVAEKNVNPPILESVMLSTVSTQGISFTSVGRVIQNPNPASVKLCQ
ncbi:hypothetical protein C7H19_00570 [Aphanothece hegewaldii CCALA 016]|uniref:DUF3124 domain-containing protein n=1 Tax=Aphanothece hegewaldii CCALA 016 TaxID=2107694 RepID=A0A2T1M3C8_9CHRO|nr:DUF3124 domain-containing protein [Aphanothece hegewaldii]PSF39316.1 hypothetical protein C7H19_00570 [Aphanothece hegewaldii CCALA 016]